MRADHGGRFTIACALVFVACGARAQMPTPKWQGEARIETLVSRTTAIHAAFGANVVAGTYMRFAFLGAIGARDVGDDWRRSGRVDVVGRFHVDPQRQLGRGLYVVGGATALFDDGAPSRVRAVVGVGLESRAYGRWIVGAEGGFGGGGRVAVTLRRARENGR